MCFANKKMHSFNLRSLIFIPCLLTGCISTPRDSTPFVSKQEIRTALPPGDPNKEKRQTSERAFRASAMKGDLRSMDALAVLRAGDAYEIAVEALSWAQLAVEKGNSSALPALKRAKAMCDAYLK